MISRICVTLILISMFIIPAMVVMDLNDLAYSTSGEKASVSQAFALPQKHTTSLNRVERRGQVLYAYYCALCHGESGNADGFNAYNMSTPPAKHSDAKVMATLSDTQIKKIIREGGPSLGRSHQMPPWGGVLTNQEITDLTAFIRTLSVADSGKY